MTEEQKDILLAKMLDAPSSLSEEELDEILHDDELRDIHEMSAMVSGAYVRTPEPDIHEEWKRFRRRVAPKPSPSRWVMRVAAIFLGILFVSAVAVRVMDHILMPDSNPVIANAEKTESVDKTVAPERIEPMAEIIDIPERRTSPALPPEEGSASARTAKQETPVEENEIDLDEYLRIQQARVDNELALLNAERYVDEFIELLPLLGESGELVTEFDETYRRVILQ